MAGSMKDIKLRIKSVESTMQITKAMELVASSKMRRAKERVEHSRPYFETLHETLTKIAAADPRARNPYLRRDEVKRNTEIFRGQIIDVTPSLYTVQLAGTSDKLDAFLASLRDVARIVEVARSGVVGLSRGDKIMR